MSVFKKRILPVIGGLIAGWVTIFGLEAINHLIYPPPEIDFTDKEALATFVEGLPTGAFILLLLAWMIGGFVGGLVSSLINKANWRNSAIIVGVIMALGAIINMTLIPHPTWLMIVTSVGFVPMALAGARLISKKK